MLYVVLALCIVSIVDAKAFQASEGTYNGEYDHLYQSGYLSEYPEKSHPFPNDPNLELKYIPHVDGKPIFIPPVESIHYQTAAPISSHRRKMRPKYGYTKYPEFTSQKKTFEDISKSISELSSDPHIAEQAFAEKPYGHDSKRKQKIKTIPSGKYNQKLHSNKLNYKENKGFKDKIVEKKSDYQAKDDLVEVPNLHVKSIDIEQDYDLPSVESLHTSIESENEDPQIPGVNGFANEAEYDFDHPEVVDASLNSKHDIDFDEYENIEVAPMTNSHPIDYEISNLENQADYESINDEVEALSKGKNKKKKHGYPSSTAIKKQKNKIGHKSKIENPVKFPSVHTSDYVYEATKKVSSELNKKPKPVKSSTKVKPITEKNVYKTVDKDLKYEDSLVKQETVEIIKKPNTHSKPVHQSIKSRDHDSVSIDDDEYDAPIETIDESIEEFDDPTVVEALVKKEPITKDEDYLDYESPKIVEALTKKKPNKKEKHEKDKNSNVKDLYKHDKQKVVKGNEKGDHKKPDLDYKNEDSKVIELLHQREDPVFLGLNQNDIEEKETLSEGGSENPENDPENINENDPLDTGSGLNNERSGLNEDARSLFLKSNVWSLVSNFHSQERNKFKSCKTPNNEPGNCMPIQMCPVPNLDLTLDDFMKKVCTIDNVFIGICCPEFPAETLKVKWDNLTDSSTDIKEKHIEQKECGEMKDSVENLHSWPWMTPLISVSTRRIFCGGVLIKSQYVLTAAHCTRKIPHNQILVILGPMSSKQDPTNQEFAVVEIKRHAQYNPRTMQNDIALLKLSKPVVLNELRRFICLPKEEANFIGEESLLLGWQGSFEASKNEETLRVISREECRKGVRMVIGPNVLCTEPRTEDIMCNLDSGAPLIVKEDGKYMVIGILSWNRNDCDSDFPAIFTRVSHFRKWIDNHAV